MGLIPKGDQRRPKGDQTACWKTSKKFFTSFLLNIWSSSFHWSGASTGLSESQSPVLSSMPFPLLMKPCQIHMQGVWIEKLGRERKNSFSYLRVSLPITNRSLLNCTSPWVGTSPKREMGAWWKDKRSIRYCHQSHVLIHMYTSIMLYLTTIQGKERNVPLSQEGLPW